MIETCINCKHHHNCMADKDTLYHIHDYCEVWKKEIPVTFCFNNNVLIGGYTDIECGFAKCHCFEAVEKGKEVSDALINNRQKYNREVKMIHNTYGK